MKSFIFKNQPKIICGASIGGPKENSGPIEQYIDIKCKNDMFNQKTFEKAESEMLYQVIKKCIENANKKESDIDLIISGDLLNQIVSSTFSARRFNIQYLGIYNACATFTESLVLGAIMVDGGYLDNVICATSSHFSTAERQYRYPLELGSTRPPQSQWTVTGGGASLVSKSKTGININSATVGKIVDFGVTDANNMGAAMAPAGAETIENHLKNLNRKPSDYDLIITGDLGTLGSRILKDLLFEKGIDIEKQHVDCGELVYNISESEYQGGSGAGCISLVFNSFIFKNMIKKKYRRILLCATGALLSSLTTQQGESIPSICHAVELEI